MSERPHCLWESPGGQTAVYLAFDVVDAINAAIVEAATEIPVRGAEIGGLLIGKAEKRTRLTVWVDRIELLPCRYERGASFRLSEEEAPDLTRPEIVGFFRSHTRKDLFLGPDDQSLIAKHFAKPEQVTLLVKPFQTRANLGGFFVWQDGKIEGAASPREFPFNRRELGGGEPVLEAVAPVVRSPYREKPEVPFPIVPAEEKRPILLWTILAFLAFVATMSISYLLFSRTKPISTPALTASSSLRLSASEGDHSVTLTWDKESVAVVSAIRGIVEIQEGTFQKKLEIGAEQLRSGRIIYSRPVAIADTIGFLLRVFPENGKAVTESVQMVSNRPMGVGAESVPLEVVTPPTQTPVPVKAAPPVQTPPRAVAVTTPKPPPAAVPARVRTETTAEPAPQGEVKTEAPKVDGPKVEGPKKEEPKPEAAKTEQPPVLVRPAPRRIP
jgi:hypothetical protein